MTNNLKLTPEFTVLSVGTWEYSKP